MALHVNRRPVDDFGNVLNFREAAGAEFGMASDEFNSRLDRFLEIWCISTSTYGGDTDSDCAEV